jgi:hypothetical protein
VTASSSHPLYPAAYLVDGKSTRPWIAAAAGTVDTTLAVDLEAGGGLGDYESGITAAGEDRSTGGGSVAEETSIVHGGTKALKLLAGAGGVGRHVATYEARPGETWRYSAWLRGDGTGAARLRIYIPLTGKWWVNGAWQSAEGDVAANATTTWTEAAGAIVLEDYEAHQDRVVVLEVHLVCTTSGQVGYADDRNLWPAWDFVSLHGHNWPPAQGLELAGSADGSSWTVLTTGAATRPAAYVYRSSIENYRHVRLRAVGTSPVRLYAGEWWIGGSIAPVERLGELWTAVEERPQLRWRTLAGNVAAASPVTDAPRSLELPLKILSDAQRAALQAFVRGTLHGVEQAVLVPYLGDPDVYLGRMGEAHALQRGPTTRHFGAALTWEESGFPTVGL